MPRYQFGLRFLVFLGHLGGIAARAFALDPGDILHEDRLGAERLDLFLCRRTHIGSRDLRAQTLGGGDRLQTGNAHPHHEDPGRLDGARSGHHHRKGATIGVGRGQHGLVSRKVRLAGEHIHALRAGDARHELHRQRFEPGLGIGLDPFPVAKRIEGRRDPGPGLRAREQGDVRRLNAEDDVRILDNRGGRADFGPRFAIGLVGDGGTQPRALLHRNDSTQGSEFFRCFG